MLFINAVYLRFIFAQAAVFLLSHHLSSWWDQVFFLVVRVFMFYLLRKLMTGCLQFCFLSAKHKCDKSLRIAHYHLQPAGIMSTLIWKFGFICSPQTTPSLFRNLKLHPPVLPPALFVIVWGNG